MVSVGNDPLGRIILDFARDGVDRDVLVESEICDDDTIPASYLFRSYSEMPQMEKLALSKCTGSILDIGAGSGIHTKHLINKGLSVQAIDVSQGAVEHMKSLGIAARIQDFYDVDEQYDTLLMMMNGIGIAGSLANLERTLLHAKQLMRENGQLLCDSTDIKYLYMEDDGGMWIDLNTEYYGNFRFRMSYADQSTDWFDWLYVDFETLETTANKIGLKVEKLVEVETQFLARITHG